MFELSFFWYSYKSSWTTSTIFDKVYPWVILYLSVKSGYILVNNMNLVFWVTTNHSSMFFKRVATENWRLALLYYKFVDLCLLDFILSGLATTTKSLEAIFVIFIELLHFLWLTLSNSITSLENALSTFDFWARWKGFR